MLEPKPYQAVERTKRDPVIFLVMEAEDDADDVKVLLPGPIKDPLSGVEHREILKVLDDALQVLRRAKREERVHG